MASLLQALFNRQTPAAPPKPSRVPQVVNPSGFGMFADYGQHTAERALQVPEYVPILFSALDVRGKAVAKAEWSFSRIGAGGTRTEVEVHPAKSVWDRPNPHLKTRGHFIRQWQQHHDLTGTTCIYMAPATGKFSDFIDTPVAMFLIRPDRVRMQPNQTGTGPAAYEYASPSGKLVKYKPRELVKWCLPSPTSTLEGLGPVMTLITELAAVQLGAEWQKNFFVNSALPGGVVTFNDFLTDDQFTTQQQRLEDQHKGVSNAHRIMMLENASFEVGRYNIREMQFPELRADSQNLILSTLGVPKTFLGQGTEVNRASADALSLIFDENQVEPALNEIQDFLNLELLPRFGDKSLCFEYVPRSKKTVEDEAKERDSKYKALQVLVASGFDPAASLAALELDPIDHTGEIPNGGMAAKSEE